MNEYDSNRILDITKNIGYVKSTITNYIKKNKSIPILDADNLSKELIMPNTLGYKKILGYFGNQILDKYSSKKTINRNLLKKIIFEDAKHREWIQKLLHPLIKEKMVEGCIRG